MTTDELLTAWRAWLAANPDEPIDSIYKRLHLVAMEVRRPSNRRRKMFKRGRG